MWLCAVDFWNWNPNKCSTYKTIVVKGLVTLFVFLVGYGRPGMYWFQILGPGNRIEKDK